MDFWLSTDRRIIGSQRLRSYTTAVGFHLQFVVFLSFGLRTWWVRQSPFVVCKKFTRNNSWWQHINRDSIHVSGQFSGGFTEMGWDECSRDSNQFVSYLLIYQPVSLSVCPAGRLSIFGMLSLCCFCDLEKLTSWYVFFGFVHLIYSPFVGSQNCYQENHVYNMSVGYK